MARDVFHPEFYRLKKLYNYLESWRSMADRIIKTMPVIRCEEKLAADALKPEQVIEEREKRKIRPPKTYSGEGYLGKPKKKLKQSLELPDGRSALESGDQAEAEPPYCVCLRGDLNADIQWIECDRCMRWYHSECLFLRLKPQHLSQSYTCDVCRVRNSLPPSEDISQSPWLRAERIPPEVWEELLRESETLPAEVKEAEILQSVEREREQLVSDAERVMRETLASRTKAELEEVEKEAALLLGKCFWMPVQLEVQGRLTNFIKNVDFGRNLNKAITSRSKRMIRQYIEQGCEGLSPENEANIIRARKRLE